jgi:hypothetical protein
MRTDMRRRRRAMAAAALAGVLALAGCGREEEPERAVVWAVGDGPDGSRDAQRVAEWIVGEDPDRFFYLGDVYQEPDYTDEEEEAGEPEAEGDPESETPMEDFYDPAYGELAEVTVPVPGDHEWEDEREEYLAYWRERHGRELPPWSSTEIAGWQVIALNTEEDVAPGSPQHSWLLEQVEEPGNCRIVLMHRPRFSAGENHGDQDDLEPVWEALAGRARIALSGNDHDMQRFKPVDGITQFVSGAGGRSIYDVDEEDERLAFSDDETDGALRLDLRPGVARHAFFSVDGERLDSGTIRCRS